MTYTMGKLAPLLKKVKTNSCMGEAWADDFQNRIIASKFCKLIDDGVKSIRLQFKVESCNGTAGIAHYTHISDVIWP